MNYTIEGSDQLINGANCTIEGSDQLINGANCSAVADGFIVSFNTTGLSADYYVIIFQLEKIDHETAFKRAYASIIPIPTSANVNISIINVKINEIFYIKVNYTDRSDQLINNATCSVIWAGTHDINVVANPFIVFFDTTGLALGGYTVRFQLEYPGYETELISTTVLVGERKSYISKILLNQLETTSDDI
ncbi:unnamed protein product, partial [marine sediment metagenome]